MNIADRIAELKRERMAIILAHYYEPLEIQDISDFVGDSFALAKLARDSAAEELVMCGVRFMAESAKILSPDKSVYLPAENAGCPMADMIKPEDVLALRAANPAAAVICYVNSSAAVKAVSDVCCTSSSAAKIVASRPEREIIFIPDKNLGSYMAKTFPEKRFIFFNGYCPVHDAVGMRELEPLRRAHPEALFLVHPECPEALVAAADYVGSTAGILDFARASDKKEFIIGTEREICALLSREIPGKSFIPLTESFICADMKKTSLRDLEECLEGKRAPLELTENELKGAAKALEAMVAVG